MAIKCAKCGNRVEPFVAPDYYQTFDKCESCYLRGRFDDITAQFCTVRDDRDEFRARVDTLQAELDATKLKLRDAVLRASTAELDLLRAQIENSVLSSKLLAKHLEYLELMADMDNK